MTPAPVASNPVLSRVLTIGGIVTGALAVVGSVIGFIVAQSSGLFSALVGVVLAALFLGITAASILIANRWNGDPLYPTLFYAIVLGGWLVKFVLFLVAMFLLSGQPWLNRTVFFIALVVSIIATLVVDVVVMKAMRIPYVSDIDLPEVDPEDESGIVAEISTDEQGNRRETRGFDS